ncbi:FAD-binding oxidoreductase [Nisaea sp.]|uniref:FAD-binding oxidoreductase n=1 Tax=Nisaea sp. TaxID=2024842 RepID=UPI003B52BA35
MAERSNRRPIWELIVGRAYVDGDPDRCAAWGRRTFGEDRHVAAVVRPGSAKEVASVMAAASEFGIPVHPVSRGANWGMGSRAPFEDGAVVLDLSRLDGISDYDADLGIVRIEPGVTFAALAGFLAGHDSEYFISEIGGSPDASVMANSLDRGDGVMADRWATLSDLEVVLADGRRVTTGFSALGADRLKGVMAGAVGPIADGLFSQSNLGIVVGARVRLARMPDDLAIVSARIDGIETLKRTLVAWRRMQGRGAIPDRSVTLWNGVKYLARDNVRSAYEEEEIRRAETDVWYLSAYLVAESPEILQLRANGVLRGLLETGARADGAIVRVGGVWQEGCEGLIGKPSPRNLRTVYWSSETIPGFAEMDPDRDRCGLLWLCLAFPFDENLLAAFAERAQVILRPFGIDLNIGVEAESFRCLLSYFSLSYGREGPESDAMAEEAYRALLAEAERHGLAPYRLANGLPKSTSSGMTDLDAYLSEIRRIGDPAGILSRGRSGIA